MGRLFDSEPLDISTTNNPVKVRGLVDTIQSLNPRDMRILFQNLSVRMDNEARQGLMHILWASMPEKDQTESMFSLRQPTVTADNPSSNLGTVDQMFSSFSREEQPRRTREEVEESIMQILIQVLQRSDRTRDSNE